MLTPWLPTSVKILSTKTVIGITELTEVDFDYLSPRLDAWWGGRSMSAMLPRLWFKHFSETSFVARDEGGRPVGFLVGTSRTMTRQPLMFIS